MTIKEKEDIIYGASLCFECKKINRRYKKCLEHTNPKSVIEKWSMASEKEWRLLTAEKFLKEEELREELVSHIN